MAAHAFVLPYGLIANPASATSFNVQYQGHVGDGVATPLEFGSTFSYDANQTPAANLTAWKASIVSLLSSLGWTVTANNIIVFASAN